MQIGNKIMLKYIQFIWYSLSLFSLYLVYPNAPLHKCQCTIWTSLSLAFYPWFASHPSHLRALPNLLKCFQAALSHLSSSFHLATTCPARCSL